MKVMGIDFGLKRIGIAFSDELKIIATPYVTYHRVGDEQDIEYFVSLINSKKVDEIVCGLPLNMQGEEQEIATLTRAFMQEIKNRTNIKITFVDERLSSVIAEDILKRTEKDWKKRKEKLDSVAASVVLQDYLNIKK